MKRSEAKTMWFCSGAIAPSFDLIKYCIYKEASEEALHNPHSLPRRSEIAPPLELSSTRPRRGGVGDPPLAISFGVWSKGPRATVAQPMF